MLTDEELRTLDHAIETAVEDDKDYRLKGGTPTYDDRRVGRMMAREEWIARLGPRAMEELRAVRAQLVTSRKIQRDQAAAAERERCATIMRDAARPLVTALYLYPHYRVDSRGPSGCIMDALSIVAPEVAADLREHDAADVFQRLYAEDDESTIRHHAAQAKGGG